MRTKTEQEQQTAHRRYIDAVVEFCRAYPDNDSYAIQPNTDPGSSEGHEIITINANLNISLQLIFKHRRNRFVLPPVSHRVIT